MRPRCSVCGRRAPLINRRCVAHMSLATETWLHVVDENEFFDVPERGVEAGGVSEGIQLPAIGCVSAVARGSSTATPPLTQKGV